MTNYNAKDLLKLLEKLISSSPVGKTEMLFRQKKLACISLVVSMCFFVCSLAVAEEKIIQKEEMSFEKCLNVISTSENKLSIAPEIIDISDKKLLGVFTLVDGTLTITCDGEEGFVVVSTKTD